MTGQGIDTPTKVPLSNDLLCLADRISAYSNSVAAEIEDKLMPLQIPMPAVDNRQTKENTIIETWPPYFHQIRGYLLNIELSLQRIEEAGKRAEI